MGRITVADSDDDDEFQYIPGRHPIEHDEGALLNQRDQPGHSSNRQIFSNQNISNVKCMRMDTACNPGFLIAQKFHQNILRKLQMCMGQVVYGDIDLISIICTYWEDVMETRKPKAYVRKACCDLTVDSEGVLLDRSLFLDRRKSYHFPDHYTRITSRTSLLYQGSSGSINACGAGQFGKVFQAVDHYSKQIFAEKVVSLDKFSKNELEILSSIEHRHIIKFYGVIRTPNGIHILMQFASGGNIDHLLQDGKGFVGQDNCNPNFFTEFWAMQYYKQVISAITYLHSKRIVHCDIKASNVVLSSDKSHCFLADFGEARKIEENSSSVNLRGSRNALVGTECYMSPEVVELSIYHFASDVWSSGCFLLNMLTTRSPWSIVHPQLGTYLIAITTRPFKILQEVPTWVHQLTKSILCSSFDEYNDRKSPKELLALAEKNLSILAHIRKERANEVSHCSQDEICVSIETTSVKSLLNEQHEGSSIVACSNPIAVNVETSNHTPLQTVDYKLTGSSTAWLNGDANIDDVVELARILEECTTQVDNNNDESHINSDDALEELSQILHSNICDSTSNGCDHLQIHAVEETSSIEISEDQSQHLVAATSIEDTSRGNRTINDLENIHQYSRNVHREHAICIGYTPEGVLVHVIPVNIVGSSFHCRVKCETLGEVATEVYNLIKRNWGISTYTVKLNNQHESCHCRITGRTGITLHVALHVTKQHSSNAGWHVHRGCLCHS